MKWLSFLSLPLLLLPHLATATGGHGPRGIHPINDRYIAVADSSIDAVLIIDSQAGGAVVGHVVLHAPTVDDKPSQWLNPLSVATCDTCTHIFVTNASMLFAIALDKPLMDMANSRDFSSLSKSSIRPFWPQNWNTRYQNDGNLRQVSIASDGSSAYVGHATAGIFSFDPLNPNEEDRRASHVIRTGDADIGTGINGLHHSSSLENLIVTREKYVHIVSLVDEDGNNPLDEGYPVAYQLALDYHCDKLYDGAEMEFMDTAIINDYAFVLGHPVHSDMSRHNGVALYRLTWYNDEEAWKDCVLIAGDGLEDANWIDGSGEESRFSNTPRDIAVLPTRTAHTILMGDVDNRVIRLVDVTVPVEMDVDTDKVKVSSIAYNEDLFQVLYTKEEPWTNLTPESVMAQDGKSYYHAGVDSLYSMNFDTAQDECTRVGIGRVCTLPEIRARFARGQYPTRTGDDSAWTTVWTAEACASCHLEEPGTCPLGVGDSNSSWGSNMKMIAVFNAKSGLQTQCIDVNREVNTFSMCCGEGGPAVLSPQKSSAEKAKQAGISMGVILPLMILAVAAYGLYMRKKAKPVWWPKFLRKDRREETGHAPHREVDLRGRDYI